MAQPSRDQPTWGSLEDATVAAAAAVLPELLRHKATATNAGAAVFPLGRLAAWNPEDPTSVGTPEQHARVALLPRVLAALGASCGADDATRRDLELIATGRGREVPLTKEHMLPLFPQARELRMGNYGSYGGCPLPVTACQHAYQVCTVDGDADRFMLRQVFGSIEDAHRVMAHYLGLRDSSNIAFVDNGAAFNGAGPEADLSEDHRRPLFGTYGGAAGGTKRARFFHFCHFFHVCQNFRLRFFPVQFLCRYA